MSAWKSRVERRFGQLARALYQYPVRALVVLLLLLGVLATQLQHIYLDTSTEGFLSPTHPAIKTYDRFREEFGRDELIIIGAQDDNVLSMAFVSQFRDLFLDLETQLENIDDIDSMINARFVHGADDELYVDDLFDPWPQNETELETIRQRIHSTPLYSGLFLGRDETMATIVIRLRYVAPKPGQDLRLAQVEANLKTSELLQIIEQRLQPWRDQGMKLYVAGSPVVTDLLRSSMVTDMQTFSKWVVFFIALLLFALFRRVTGVVLPLICVGLSVLFTISLMGLFRQPLQLPTAILPSFLLVVGIGDAIHFLSLFYARFNEHCDKQQAVVEAMEHSGLAMFLTSLTTAAGMASFANADLLPISNLGIFTAAGVMSAFVVTVLVMPASLSLLPLKPRIDASSPHTSPVLNRFIKGCVHLSYHHPKSVVAACAVILLGSLASVLHLQFTHNPLKWLPDSLYAKQSIVTIDRDLGGSVSLEIVLDSGEPGGLYEPALLQKLDTLCLSLSQFSSPGLRVNKVLSITELLKETHRALHDNSPEFYRIPDNRELVAQEMFMLELSGSEDLFRLVDREYRKARITLTLPWIDTLLYAPLMNQLENRFKQEVGDYPLIITGLIPLLGSTLNSVIHSAAEAYVIAVVVISLIMVVLLGRIRLGLISMFPNILPIIMVMGLMQLNNVPFDMFSILIGSIAIGLCVDDTVHFMHHYGRFRERGCSVHDAISNTLNTAGRAMLVTSLVLCAGFMVLTMSQLNNFTHFGLYTSLCIVLALMADFLLAPALVTLISGRDDVKKATQTTVSKNKN